MPHKSSEVSDMFDIEPRTLFVYESENLIAPERTPTQRRRYSRRDIERIRLIRELTTVHGINLAGVKVIFSLMEAAVDNGVRLIPCAMTMEVFGFKAGDFIEAAEAPCGAATFVDWAQDSDICLFI